MNKVIFIGRLTKDPEIKVTQSGKKLANFSIAINDGKDLNGEKLTQFFNCVAWEKLADVIDSYVSKGHQISIIGKLQNRTWDKPDGTKGYATDVLVKEIEMLTSKSEEGSVNSYNNNSQPSTQQTRSVVEDEDLPEVDFESINVQMPF